MYKLLYAAFAALGLMLVSCGDNAESDGEQPELNPKDKKLIAAIQGKTRKYKELFDLEDYLIENGKLSDDVVQALIKEKRVPDYTVETSLVLSAPLSSDAMKLLAEKRPELKTSAIKEAATLEPGVEFVILNMERRVIIFGHDLQIKSKEGEKNCNCGEKEISAKKSMKNIQLTTVFSDEHGPHRPPCVASSQGLWTCGELTQYIPDPDGGEGYYILVRMVCQYSGSYRCMTRIVDLEPR